MERLSSFIIDKKEDIIIINGLTYGIYKEYWDNGTLRMTVPIYDSIWCGNMFIYDEWGSLEHMYKYNVINHYQT
jgi:antitoxin component YwqK of YwqJK toxin-antitoxin module